MPVDVKGGREGKIRSLQLARVLRKGVVD